MSIQIHSWRLGPMDNNTALLIDEETREAILVDPSFESETIAGPVDALGCRIVMVLNTHAHFDHVIGNRYWAERTGAPIALHPEDLPLLHALPDSAARFGFHAEPSPEPSLWLQHGQQLALGASSLEVRHVPGHAPGHVALILPEEIVAGDTLFRGSIGRTDLPGGSLPTLLSSIADQLLTLPHSCRVLPGHGEATTLAEEWAHNPFLASLREQK